MKIKQELFLLPFLAVIISGFDSHQASRNEENLVSSKNSCLNPRIVQINVINELDPETGEIYSGVYPVEDDTYSPAEKKYPIVVEVCGEGKNELSIKIDVSFDSHPSVFSTLGDADYYGEIEPIAQEEEDFDSPKIPAINYSALRDKAFGESCVDTDEQDNEPFPIQQLKGCINHAFKEGLKPICDHERKLKDFLTHYEGKKGFENTVRTVREQLFLNEENKQELVSEIYKIAVVFDQKCEELNPGIQYNEAHYNLNRNSPLWNKLEEIIELASYKPGEGSTSERLRVTNDVSDVNLGSEKCDFKDFVKTQASLICGRVKFIFSESEDPAIHSQ